MIDRVAQLSEVLDHSKYAVSMMKPSEWAEQNMYISSGKFQGPLSFDRTPYSREILDCFSPYHYSTEITLMGGAQWGKSSTVIEPLICWLIAMNACNIGFLTGHSDLSDEAMAKLDLAIANSQIGHLIRPSVIKTRNSRTGDTNKSKEFIGGSLIAGSATNHKLLRQRSWQYTLVDDLEAAKAASKQSGSTLELIRARSKSFGLSKKIGWISTPENAEGSLIIELFEAGDQRRWHIPCTRCGELIVLKWEIPIDGSNEKAGFVWREDKTGNLVPGSVEYVCQCCGNGFDESGKYEQNLSGLWVPGTKAQDPQHVSFHLPSLYAMPGMNGWDDAVKEFLRACPTNGGAKDFHKLKTFYNLTLGEGYADPTEGTSAKEIQANQRDYAIGIIPETLSERDGNGRIVLLTIGMDCNGTVMGVNGSKENDARIDYQIKAWAETGASYSIKQGSIGTFVPRERSAAVKADRIKWTYEVGKPNSVWPLIYEIVTQIYKGDKGGNFKINRPGIDVGMYSDYILPFIDFTIGRNPQNPVIGLRGDKELEFVLDNRNLPLFKEGAARKDVFYLQVGFLKDMLSNNMKLRWDRENDTSQPYRFMNFPMSQLYVCPVKKKYNDILGVKYEGDYLYQTETFFNHYEAEHRSKVTKESGSEAFRWVKKSSLHQNHFWDTDVYNLAIVEIVVRKLGKVLEKETKIPAGEFTWTDFVNYVTS